MSNHYRVHYKRGDLEIEVESTDKNFVDQLLHKFVPLSQGRQSHRGKGKGTAKEVIKFNIERKGSQRKAKRSRIHQSM